MKKPFWLDFAWKTLRRATGDDSYERYLEHFRQNHEGAPLSRKDFFAQETSRKWEGVRRCC